MRKFDEQRIGALVIQHDDDPMNPREWDNVGVMACWHKRYTLGDDRKAVYAHTPSEDWLEPWGTRGLEPHEWLKTVPKGSVILPLYLYDHSGITMSTGPFSCPWDSGQVGWIVATPAAIRKSFMVKRITKKIREKVEAALRAEVATYDLYLTGQCWGYVITDNEGEDDSCWGFLGSTLEETGLKEALPDAAIPLLEQAWETRYQEAR